MTKVDSDRTGLEIAVIGMAGRFPGAKNLEQFWDNLKNGIESISFFSKNELEDAGLDPGLIKNPDFVKAYGVLENPGDFDASFFNYNPAEAAVMDPQIRILHECVWEALENAGYVPDSDTVSIGLYAGASPNFFWEASAYLSRQNDEPVAQFSGAILNNKDFLSTRISYNLDLSGPSFALHTACSTSLVAVDLACRGLLTGQCDIALAGGAAVCWPPQKGYTYREGMIFSPDGHCRSFDEKAKGSVFGEGVGIVALKLLENAIHDRDSIHAVIRGSASNNDGSRKVGYTAPGIKGQADVIKAALYMARVEHESISYIEAHGTATILGDPVEIKALNHAFDTDKKGFCRIGTVKTNVGHLDAASGAAGLIKTVLALKYKQIPPSLYFEAPNPKINFENSPFSVVTKLTPWKNDGYPLRAGVSSFGIGGTNAHVVLEEWPAAHDPQHRDELLRSPEEDREYQLILLSAKTQSALDTATENLVNHLKKEPGINLADVAYTLQVGRKAFQYRRMTVCPGINEAIERLSDPESRNVHTSFLKEEKKSIVFVLSGLGSQYVNMGLELYQREPVFRREMDRCFDILRPFMGYDIKNILYPSPASSSPDPAVDQPEVAPLVIFIFEYALAKLLIKWGITPDAMIGYSFGEYVAACLSGIFSLEDALNLIVLRSQLIKETPPGAMLSVPVAKEKLQPLLKQTALSLAIDNGPSCIVSGPAAAIDAFEEQMKEKRYICMRLRHASRALHSYMMEPMAIKFEEKLGQFTLNKPQIPYISNVTGQWITAEEAASPGYWSRHLRETVEFAAGIKELVKEPGSLFVEIGPGQDLAALLLRYLEDQSDQHVVNLVRHPQRKISDVYYLLNKIGQLWLYGAKIDWPGFYSEEERRRISLPSYPFERQWYGIDDPLEKKGPAPRPKKSAAGKMPDIANWFYLFQWERSQLVSHPSLEIPGHACWLVFINELDFCSRLVKRLLREGRDLVLVEKGSTFSKTDEQSYTINPREGAHYRDLMDELQRENRIPVNIVHLWNISDVAYNYEEIDRTIIDNAQDLGLYSLLYLARVLGEKNFSEKFNIHLVSNNLHEVVGDEVLFPEKATVLGLARTVQQEFVNIKCRCIDIVLPEPHSRREEILVEQLLGEFSIKTSDTVIAYRLNYRWVETYKPIRLEKVEADEDISRLREKGVYLITGGLGNIGFILAKYLAKKFKAKLVLSGRTTIPPRIQWEDYLTVHEKEDGISQKIRKVRELEKMGSEVLTISADAADEKQMQKVIFEAEAQLGSINGVIHAAGTLDAEVFRTVSVITKKEFLAQFRPKVYGTVVLRKIFRDKSLDFCLLVSSPAAILGGLGFAAYAAANMFLDAFVYRVNRDNSLPWITVNWGDWESEGNKNKKTSHGTTVNEMLMTPEEGVDTFRRILKYADVNQVVVSAGDLQDRFNKWVKLETLPGEDKAKKKTSGSLKPRPNLMDPYEAPGNPVEETLVDIWENLFGFEKIGVHDNFFELGGDSLKLLQVAARMDDAGYKAKIRDVFESQTISELARLLKEINQAADESLVTGIVPLTPIQETFFKTQTTGLHHQNSSRAMMLYFEKGFDEEAVNAVFQKIWEHHDVLRMTFKKENGEILQRNEGLDYPFSLQVYDYRNSARVSQMLQDKTNEFQATIDAEKGPLMKIGLFHLDDGDRLLIVIHNLVMDNISGRILFEDIDLLYRQYKKGEKFELPSKTCSFKLWSEKLSGYANSKLFLKEKTYWKELESAVVPRIEKDFANQDDYALDMGSLSFNLSEGETGKLLKEANFPFGTGTKDILLIALGLAIKKIYGYNQLLVALEGHGREEILTDVDINRTIGCFTSVYPVILDFSIENDLSRQVKEVKENLRQCPNKGVGYGILKYLTWEENKPGIEFKLNPQLRFNYWGDPDQYAADAAQQSFKIAEERRGNALDLKGHGGYDFDISGIIVNKQLVVSITCNKKQYKPGTIEVLLDHYKRELSHIVSYCSGLKEKELTPSDLTYKKLSINRLDRLKEQYLLEDICRLSPMQEGMLFHALYDPSSPAYILQKSYRLHGELDVSYVEKSINELVKRYDIFRTVFIHDGFERPIQVVLKARHPDVYFEDIRKITPPGDRELFVKEFKENDRKRLFDLSNDVLMRVSVLQADKTEYEFIWTTHHILMAGQGLETIIPEFFEIYNSYIQGREYRLPAVKSYRTYIEWLEKQDKEASKNYWKIYLENYNDAAGVPEMNPPLTIEPGYRLGRYFFHLEREKTIALNRLAERNRVTLNTVIQAVWGIILGKYNGKQDVVFGAVVSWRPGQVEDEESIIGLFINTIPVRIQFKEETTFNNLLHSVQEDTIDSQPHYYYSLADIQSGSLIKQNLFNNFITFDKYPVIEREVNEDKENKKGGTFKLSGEEYFEQNSYNFNLIVISHEQIYMEIKYNANAIDENIVKKMALQMEEVINIILEDDTIKIEDIKISHGLSKAKSTPFQEDRSGFRL